MKNIIYLYYDSKIHHTVLVDRKGNQYLIDSKPVPILKQMCLKYGTSYQGAKQSFSFLTGSKKKVPICISVVHRLIFIPTASEKMEDCCFIQYDQIDRVKSNESGCSVYFKTGQIFDLSISFRTIQRQRHRCSLFLDRIMDL